MQTALDGYVCCFAYGQTGSDKTYTMEDMREVIPRAVQQIFQASKKLREQGWQVVMIPLVFISMRGSCLFS